jgi:hypothetical protein
MIGTGKIATATAIGSTFPIAWPTLSQRLGDSRRGSYNARMRERLLRLRALVGHALDMPREPYRRVTLRLRGKGETGATGLEPAISGVTGRAAASGE